SSEVRESRFTTVGNDSRKRETGAVACRGGREPKIVQATAGTTGQCGGISERVLGAQEVQRLLLNLVESQRVLCAESASQEILGEPHLRCLLTLRLATIPALGRQ